MAWIKWNQILASHEKGGLDIGFGDSIQGFGVTLLLRLNLFMTREVSQKKRLSNTDDSWTWNLGEDGNFHVSDARKLLDDLHLPNSSYHTRSKFIPLKINIFIWRLIMDRLPTRTNLAVKGFDIDTIICPICSVGGDSRDHTFIFCRIANSTWRRIRIWMAIPWPDSFIAIEDAFNWMDSLNGSLSKKTRIYGSIAATLWWLWRFRNDTFHGNCTIKERDLFDNIRLSSFS
ncbi:uncharacterized protein [Rutidosis leptorrhynchoides]|uniref:uncharacterized protein n=1 Tax=Rutidosis leptorrhynchoides TaxID=125765 RepID=UPI003A9919E8